MTSPITNISEEMPFNRLSAAEVERLAILAEECGEVVQIVGKILRHGYESCAPGTLITNRYELQKEMGDVRCAMMLLFAAGDANQEDVGTWANIKRRKISNYLHHQKPQENIDENIGVPLNSLFGGRI